MILLINYIRPTFWNKLVAQTVYFEIYLPAFIATICFSKSKSDMCPTPQHLLEHFPQVANCRKIE